MRKEFQDILERKFAIPVEEGRSKVYDLKEAVLRQVKPGMMLYFAFTQTQCPSAAVYEIARQFWGQKTDFTIADLAFTHPLEVLVHGGLVKKVITGSCGDTYYTPAPCRVYQKAFKAKTVEIENCSLLTYIQRIKAGAMGLPFMPTKSLIGSDIFEEDKENVQIMKDPFGSGQILALVKAIQPDLAFAHALAADPHGNAIFPPPYGDNLYGAMGSRNGVLLTTEKIVSTDLIREYSHFTKLPGYLVNSVSEVPFGAHPSGVYNPGIRGIAGYIEDYDFFDEVHRLSADPEKFNLWIKEWVLDCKDHSDYLKKLGHERVCFLQGKSHPNSWRYELEEVSDSLDPGETYNELEMMLVVASRKLAEKAKQKNCRTIVAGGGFSYLTAAMGTYALKEEGYDVDMTVTSGMFGVLARPTEPYLLSHATFPTCKILTDAETMMGIFTGGANNRCIGSLASAEVDKHGNINTTKVLPQDTFIVGSGGNNDICSTSQEVVITAIQSPARFLDKVSYITSPGKKIKTLVSTLGVFEKLGEEEEFSLTGYFPNPKLTTPADIIANIKKNCGWDLRVSPRVAEIPPPTAAELRTLRLLDTPRHYLGKK